MEQAQVGKGDLPSHVVLAGRTRVRADGSTETVWSVAVLVFVFVVVAVVVVVCMYVVYLKRLRIVFRCAEAGVEGAQVHHRRSRYCGRSGPFRKLGN